MGRLYLAANYIDATSYWILPNDIQNSGHMQIVYDNGVDLLEAEINGASGGLFDLYGEWRFIPFGRDHDDSGNTPYMNDRVYTSGYYGITALAPRSGQSADHVWELIGQIHASMASHGVEIEYDINQNSNTFITTVLNAVGIPFTQTLLNSVRPEEVWNFPGAFVDILQNGARVTDYSQTRTPIVLEVAGTAGNDYIQSGIGNDTLGGVAGRDTIYGDNGDDLIRGGAGHDRLYGENGNDRVDGGADNDVLRGGAGDDSLWGGDGHDILTGDDGDDFLQGNAGDDLLTGSGGHDTFFFAAGDGRDTISDFGLGLGGDVIWLDVSGFADFEMVASVASAVAGGVRLSFGADMLMLTGIELDALDAGDFFFV